MRVIRATALLVLLGGMAWATSARAHTYSVYVDRDNDSATGCTLATASGAVIGVDVVLGADVSVEPVQVAGQWLARCEDGVLQPATPLPGSYPVGFDPGVDGFDVVELGAPLDLFGAGGDGSWRLVFGAEGALLDGSDLTDSVVVAGLGQGEPPVVAEPPQIVPTASLTGLAALALLLAIAAVLVVRRRPQLLSAVLVVCALGASGIAWAAAQLLDGQIDEWPATPRVVDAADDATQEEPPIDIRQAFASRIGDWVHFRIDVTETRLSELLPALLDTQFTVAENSANGTSLGPVRTDASGLGALLNLAAGAQVPTTAFAFDPATTQLTVADAAALDFETNPEFTLELLMTVDGVPALSELLTATITVDDVNETPTFAAQTFTVPENAATGSSVGTAIANDADAGTNGVLGFAITGGSGQAVFAISASGNITVADGSAIDIAASPYTLDVTASDGGTPSLTATATLSITVENVNDAPTFTPGADVTVAEDSGAYDAVWATALDDGDDGSQTLNFTITANDNPALFASAPTLSISGTDANLAFTPAADANGTAQLTAVLRDDGGTANDGTDESAPVTFTITVTAANDAPELTVPGAQASDGVSPTVFSTANGNAISVADIDADTGTLTMSFTTSAGATITLADPDATLAITGNGTDNVIATGTLDALDAALNGPSGSLGIAPTPGNTRAQTLTIGATDNGNTGAGGALTDSATIDIDAPPAIDASPTAGAIATDTTFTLSFSEPVDVAAGAITLDCGSGNLVTGGASGTAITTLSPTYPTPLPEGATCVLAVSASGVSDSDGIDPPNAPTADFSRSYTIDSAPVVTVTSPANGATVPNTVALAMSFSEAVDITAGALTLDCGGPITLAGATGTDVTTLAPTYTAPLPSGTCTLTIAAIAIDDSDSIDPPANPAADTVITFTIDAPPSVTATSPVDGDAGVTTDAAIAFTFDEAVDATTGAVTLDCGGPIAGTLSGQGTTTLAFTPDALLPAAANCTATALASAIADVDAIDPPDTPLADTAIAFSTDSAPQVTATTPANGAIVANDTPLAISFGEPVDATAGSVTLSCAGSPNLVNGGTTGTAVTSLVPTYAAPLPSGTCVLTVLAASIDDSDTIDPPGTMPADHVVTFTVDAAPSVQSMSPANGATAASDTNIALTFSEPVDIPSAAAFSLECGGMPMGYTVTSPAGLPTSASSVTIDPTGNLPAGATCTFTAFASQLPDTDTLDPPDTMPSNHVSTFTIDALPAVIATSPPNDSITSNRPVLTYTFSEPVNIDANALGLTCLGPGVVPGTATPPLPASNATSISYSPNAPLPGNAICQLTLLGNAVHDVDSHDPPDTMPGNHDIRFQVEPPDVPVAVTFTTPTEGAVVPNNQSVTLNFSDAVNIAAGAVTFTCGVSNVTFAPILPLTNISTLVLTPSATLRSGETCTVTLESTLVTDVDTSDPPNELDGNASGDSIDGDTDDFTLTFSVDAPPTPLTIGVDVGGVPTFLPLGGGQRVDRDSDIRVTFSEPVDITPASITLQCPNGSPVAFAGVPATNATTVTLNPIADLPPNTTCVLTLVHTGISDTDSIDPPNALDGNGNGVEGDSVAVTFITAP